MRTINPIKAIRHYCLDCMGGSRKYVRECENKECAFLPYRFGRKLKNNENAIPTLLSIKMHCQKCGEKKRIDATRCNVAECPVFSFRKGHNPNRKGIGNKGIANLKKVVIDEQKGYWANILAGDIVAKEELAEILKVKVKTIKWLVTSRQIPFFRMGKEVRFFRSQIEAWLLGRVYTPQDINKLTPRIR